MKSKILYFVLAYVLLIVVMFLLPPFSASDYSLVKNTTSQLGAQSTPNAWIMNVTFVALGLSVMAAGWKFLKNYWLQRIVLLVFGVSLVFVAIYSHAPIDITLDYSHREHQIHSVFSSVNRLLIHHVCVFHGIYIQAHVRPVGGDVGGCFFHIAHYLDVQYIRFCRHLAADDLHHVIWLAYLCVWLQTEKEA
ncbi:DUF998 domain-containing protein, partial [Fulvivirga kasyanovii]